MTQSKATSSSPRMIAIGDVHGCLKALDTLLKMIRIQPEDHLVLLGDYVDRGPDSRGVIERLMELKGQCHLVALMGNHEEMVLAAHEGRSEREFWMKFGGEEALASYGPLAPNGRLPREHLDFLRNCPMFLETNTHIFVHADYYPNRPMPEQSSNTLLWSCFDPGKAAPHYSGKTVVLGHTPQQNGEVLDLGFLQCIDTFCHAGGWLTALEVHSGKIWQSNEKGEIREKQLKYLRNKRRSQCK